jgi:hypothetical protein
VSLIVTKLNSNVKTRRLTYCQARLHIDHGFLLEG